MLIYKHRRSDRQTVVPSGFETFVITWHELFAGTGSLRVDAACHFHAQLPLQQLTAGLLGMGSLHATHQRTKRLGQVRGHCAARRVIGLRPVERHPEIRAARTTLLAVEISTHDNKKRSVILALGPISRAFAGHLRAICTQKERTGQAGHFTLARTPLATRGQARPIRRKAMKKPQVPH